MTTIKVQAIDTEQINYILAFAKKENLKFEISEPEFDDTYISTEKLYAKIDRGIVIDKSKKKMVALFSYK